MGFSKRRAKRQSRTSFSRFIFRVFAFIGFAAYSILSFKYFFDPSSVGGYLKLFFYIYPFLFLSYIYSFKDDFCRSSRILKLGFNLIFLVTASLVTLFVASLIMNPWIMESSRNVTYVVFFMGSAMLFDFIIIEAMNRKNPRHSPKRKASPESEASLSENIQIRNAQAPVTQEPSASESAVDDSLEITARQVAIVIERPNSCSSEKNRPKLLSSKDAF